MHTGRPKRTDQTLEASTLTVGVTAGVTGVTQDFSLSNVSIYGGVTTDRASLEAGVTRIYYLKNKERK